MRTNIRIPLSFIGWGLVKGLTIFVVRERNHLKSQRLEPAITKNVPHGETFCLCIKLKKMWNLISNISANRFDYRCCTFYHPVSNLSCKVFFVGGKKRNIAFQLVLWQSHRISFTFSVCCPFYRTCLKITELYKARNRCNVYPVLMILM